VGELLYEATQEKLKECSKVIKVKYIVLPYKMDLSFFLLSVSFYSPTFLEWFMPNKLQY
jgi:hypothetical protein